MDLLPEGTNSFLKEQFFKVWKITFTILGELPLKITIFIKHLRVLRNGSYANGTVEIRTDIVQNFQKFATMFKN